MTPEEYLRHLQEVIPKNIEDQDQLMELDEGLFLLQEIEIRDLALEIACHKFNLSMHMVQPKHFMEEARKQLEQTQPTYEELRARYWKTKTN